MGTIFEIGQFWFICRANERATEPAHVHVKFARTREARIDLLSDAWMDPQPPNAAKAMRLYHEHKEQCVTAWNENHPDRRIG
ncbi:MAG: hypothetical protein ACOYOB_21540 [Myxococcota bacterium]|jgi:hypothetical protein